MQGRSPRLSVHPYHKALLLTAVCALVLMGGLIRATLQAPRPLTSAEILAATRTAVDRAIAAAIAGGGLADADAFVSAAIRGELRRQGFGGVDVALRRPNDLNPLAALYFFIEVGEVAARFEVEGVRDPLLAIRLGLDVRIRADPFHPYTSHREPGVLAACLAHRYYHIAPEGPDLFARLENRTRDPYHFGFETFLSDRDDLAVDHSFLEGGWWGLDDAHRARYGL